MFDVSLNKVVVYISPADKHSTAHTSIKIKHNGKKEYISLYSKEVVEKTPSNFPRRYYLSSNAILRSWDDDVQHRRDSRIYRLEGMDLQKMFDHAHKLKRKIEDGSKRRDSYEVFANDLGISDENESSPQAEELIPFGFCRRRGHLCSSIVFELLEVGEIHKKIPYYANIFHPWHLFLLSIRPSLSIATIAPVIFHFLMMGQEVNPSTVSLAVVFFTLQLFVVVLCENRSFWAPLLRKLCKKCDLFQNFFPTNTRKLIEPCKENIIVKFLALLGFGTGGIASLLISHKVTSNISSFGKFFIDIFLWSGLGFSGYLLLGVLASAATYFLAGLAVYVRPAGLEDFLQYLQETKELDENKVKTYFKRESAQLLMIAVSFIGGYIFWEENDSPTPPFFIEGGFSIFVGCALTLLLNSCKYPEKKENPLIEETELEKSLEVKPFQFALTSICTGVIANAAIYTSNLYILESVALSGFFGMVGASIGYTTGAALSAGWEKLHHSKLLSRCGVMCCKKRGESQTELEDYLSMEPSSV